MRPGPLVVALVTTIATTSAADPPAKTPGQAREEIHYLARAHRSRMTECLPLASGEAVTVALVLRDRRARILVPDGTAVSIARCLDDVAATIHARAAGSARLTVVLAR